LAEAVGVSTPAAAPIEMKDGNVVFGSRRVPGVAEDIITQFYLTTPSVTNFGTPPATGLTPLLSAIYAFDMFNYNDDRHFGNYLTYDDNGTRRLHAFDFSRALFWRWPWSGFPTAADNTRVCGALLRQLHGFDFPAASATLTRLGGLPTLAVANIINMMPASWLSPSVVQAFLQWWDSGERTVRIQLLTRGLSDGSLL
jgi:hypothetical protein